MCKSFFFMLGFLSHEEHQPNSWLWGFLFFNLPPFLPTNNSQTKFKVVGISLTFPPFLPSNNGQITAIPNTPLSRKTKINHVHPNKTVPAQIKKWPRGPPSPVPENVWEGPGVTSLLEPLYLSLVPILFEYLTLQPRRNIHHKNPSTLYLNPWAANFL